jgi:hypothetical protein
MPLASFAAAWLDMSRNTACVSQMPAVCTAGMQAGTDRDEHGPRAAVIDVLGQTLLVPGTKPLHQSIQALLRNLPDVGASAGQLSALLENAVLGSDSLALPAALVSCLGSGALSPHLVLEPSTLLPLLCRAANSVADACSAQRPSPDGTSPPELRQDQIDLVLDSGRVLGFETLASRFHLLWDHNCLGAIC